MERLKKTIEIYDKYAKNYVRFSYPNLLQFQLTQFISYLPKKALILDVGCGSGKDAEYLVEEGFKVTAIDISKKILEEASMIVESTVEFKQMDMMDLKFDDSSFDGLWCQAALIHIPKKHVLEVLKGFNRVMKEKGALFLGMLEGEGEKMVEYLQTGNEPRFFAYYKQVELEQLLEEAGFTILKSDVEEAEDESWVNVFCRKN